MNDTVLKARQRLLTRLTNFIKKHPEGVTVKQMSKGVSISTDLLCELLTEVKAEVKGELWTLPKEQPSEEIDATPSVEQALTINRQQPIKEKPMSHPDKLQKFGIFTNINEALEEQIKRLRQSNLDAESMTLEAARTRALTSISEQFIKQGQVVLEATKVNIEFGGNRVDSSLLTVSG